MTAVPRVRRGDIWWCEFPPPAKSRPVVVLSRQQALAVLHTAIVAPVTSTVRGLPSEVALDAESGLGHASVTNFDHVTTVPQRALTQRIGQVPEARLGELCRALAVAVGCDG